FFFQAEDGIRDRTVTGVQTCALPIWRRIGVVVQEQAADLLLNVRDNLLTFARFHGVVGAPVRRCADGVMRQFGIDDVADRKVQRSEERRVGKEGRGGWWAWQGKRKVV